LYCGDNQLISLNVSNNTALTGLGCSGNSLTSLNVSNNTALESLRCCGNQLTNMDVSNNTALERLYCSENQLTSLDVSYNTALEWFDCSDNQLTSLYVSNNTALFSLACGGNQLTSLDVSNNTLLQVLYIEDMPTLNHVCVWSIPFPPAGINVYREGSPNVYFTNECATNVQGEYKTNNTIDIYPNPSDDIINIEIENVNKAVLEIYSVGGRLVFSKELNSKIEKIDISGFPKGIYIIKVMQNSTVNVGKVVVR
jgi:Leucine-rich repeat (LRR) protein